MLPKLAGKLWRYFIVLNWASENGSLLDPGPRMGAGDAEVDQERGHRFQGHRGAPVGVHGVRDEPASLDDVVDEVSR